MLRQVVEVSMLVSTALEAAKRAGATSDPISAATTTGELVRLCEELTQAARAVRNESIRQALAAGSTPGRVARSLGLSKTYVLRVRQDHSEAKVA